MFVLLVVGVMDDARAEIIGDGKISLSFVEHASQVCCVFLNLYMILVGLCSCARTAPGLATSKPPITRLCKRTSLFLGLLGLLLFHA